MNLVQDSFYKQREEAKLAKYLIQRVCGKASGAFDEICTSTSPHDRYFIGSLRPRPLEELPKEKSFLDELVSKIAPMAIGGEVRVNLSKSNEVIFKFEWDCFYRIFPTFEEQLKYQTNKVKEEEPIEANKGSEGEESDEDQKEIEAELETAKREKRYQQKDVLFPKFKKVHCTTIGSVTLNKNGQEWEINNEGLERALKEEFNRVKEAIKLDPERIRARDIDEKVKVPPEALNSEETFNLFKNSLVTEPSYPWGWEFSCSVRSSTKQEKGFIFSFEATNSSSIDSKSWHSEGFLFNAKITADFQKAEALAFELESAPHSFRYDRLMWGRGFNCVIHKLSNGNIYTTINVPVYEQARYSTNDTPRAAFKDLSTEPIRTLESLLEAMKTYDKEWQSHYEVYIKSFEGWEDKHGEEFSKSRASFREEIKRFEDGLKLIKSDSDVRLAFELTNQTFPDGKKDAWRLFQIVFLVSQIPGIYGLKVSSELSLVERSLVDIVYFPTGGGKTEAYLSAVIFHCFFDRLRGKTAGVTAWTRFPLRLLTLQQTQRVADVIGRAEILRKSHSDPRLSGKNIDKFAVGYFVGGSATPNKLNPPDKFKKIPDADWVTANDPEARQKWKRIFKCPSCRTSTVVIDFNAESVNLIHRCTQANCKFEKGILPIYVVDTEIYRYLPSIMVGTIDKLATLGHQRNLSLVLGQVTGKCSLHGYCNIQCCQGGCQNKNITCEVPQGVSGPTLFIQDELHLLKEGLGTFDGHYETFLQNFLKSIGQETPVKIIASSATIEAFDRQVSHLYGRKARVFPGLGPTLSRSFYAKTFDYPQRFFVGILPHNKTTLNSILELFQYYHEEVDSLLKLDSSNTSPFGGYTKPGSPEWDSLVDLYATSLGYFSANRELNSVRTDLENHVSNELEKEGFSPLRIAELTSSTSTDDVTTILEHLEMAKPREIKAPNSVLATSMVSHGVDVDRFNAMFFYGMPRQNAEYIQASSRVGRSHVGIVFDCFKPARERDQSHFSYFEKYHEYLGQLVEPVAINRWSKFSIERTLPGLFMSVLLQGIANRPDNKKPNTFYKIDTIKQEIISNKISSDDFVDLLQDAYLTNLDGEGPKHFKREVERGVPRFISQIMGARSSAMWVSEALIPGPMTSLRDVDEQLKIELDTNGSTWAARIKQERN